MAEDLTPIEQAGRNRAGRVVSVAALILLCVFLYGFRRYNPDFPVFHKDVREHFKYGSIAYGQDIRRTVWAATSYDVDSPCATTSGFGYWRT